MVKKMIEAQEVSRDGTINT
ncbi:hypothetical protein [Blautia hansenii]